jgi:hypothetical protein
LHQERSIKAKFASIFASGDLRMKCNQGLGGHSTLTSLFKTIPPERIGLQGEYDHQGLAKRVSLTFRQHCSESELEGLRVMQRGAVVVIISPVVSQRLLIKLVNLAMSISGTTDVEVNGVSVGYSLKQYLEVKPSPEGLQALQKAIT